MVLKPQLTSHLKKLEYQFKILRSIFERQLDFNFSPQEKGYLQHPFPIVLMTEQEDAIEMYDAGSREFRAVEGCDLVLGQRISLMATDKPENQKELDEYLQKHKLDVPVVLFSELELGVNPRSVIEKWLKPYLPQIPPHPNLPTNPNRAEPISIVMGYLYNQHLLQDRVQAQAQTQNPGKSVARTATKGEPSKP